MRRPPAPPSRARDEALRLVVMLALVLLAAWLTAGCTAPVIQVPIGQAALLYADAKTAYTVLSMQVAQACAAGKFKPDVCAEAKSRDEVVKLLDADVRTGILEAKGQIDWKKIMDILQVLAGLAVKVGGL